MYVSKKWTIFHTKIIFTIRSHNSQHVPTFFKLCKPTGFSDGTNTLTENVCAFSVATLSANIMVEAPGHIAIKLSPVGDKIELAFWPL